MKLIFFQYLTFVWSLRSTLIVPKSKKNYRLTYYPYPHFINSAVNDDTRPRDYFAIEETITQLTNNDSILCNSIDSESYFELCSKFDKGFKTWKILDTYREARFKDEDNNCLTINYNKKNDIYDLYLTVCNKQNENQIFILTADHGDKSIININAENVMKLSLEDKKQFTIKNTPFNVENKVSDVAMIIEN